VVAATEEEAKNLFEKQYSTSNAVLKQDEDCLDTWFSSWLWPFEVFEGYSNPGNEDIKYYYPTNTLVTAPEIIFFWVARMIMAGFEYKKEKPFNEVYFTGIVRDKLGRKMSKSLGNSPDLLALIDQYGADASRFGIMISSPAGNDLLWDESSNEQGSHFINKIWNALKLVKMWEGRKLGIEPVNHINDKEQSNTTEQWIVTENPDEHFAIRWFESRLNEVRAGIEEMYKDFRLSEILKTIYSLIWDDFCSWYLEWIKPGFEQPVAAHHYDKTITFFEELMQLLHPFMPFITEEIYHQLKERNDDLTVKPFPALVMPDEKILAQGRLLKEVITALRDTRNRNQLKPKDPVKLHILSEDPGVYKPIEGILSKQVNAEEITYTNKPVGSSITVVVQKDKFFIETSGGIDTTSQKQQLKKDLDYLKGFLVSVDKKLSNEKFVSNAKPEVIEMEKRKKADAEAKIRIIEESLAAL
jgi:valyl-tRNA synthetase